MVVVDDGVLLDVLAGNAQADIRRAVEAGELFTTGCWYYRLSRAVHSEPMTGALSRRLAAFSVERRLQVVTALNVLPPEIGLLGLLGLRTLVPIMRALKVTRPVNMLTAEALAAALLDRTIIWNERQPRRLLTDYLDHYNDAWSLDRLEGPHTQRWDLRRNTHPAPRLSVIADREIH